MLLQSYALYFPLAKDPLSRTPQRGAIHNIDHKQVLRWLITGAYQSNTMTFSTRIYTDPSAMQHDQVPFRTIPQLGQSSRCLSYYVLAFKRLRSIVKGKTRPFVSPMASWSPCTSNRVASKPAGSRRIGFPSYRIHPSKTCKIRGESSGLVARSAAIAAILNKPQFVMRYLPSEENFS